MEEKFYEKNKSVTQITRIDGNNCFLEVVNTGFQIGKIFFNFITYNPDTFKQTAIIPIYIDIQKWLAMSEDIKLGVVKRESDNMKAQILQQGGYAKAIRQDMGGTNKAKLAQQNKSRADGRDEARVFSILPATLSKSMDIILQAERGPGEETEQGLIAPKFNYKDKANYQKIMVSMKHEDLKGLACLIDMHLQSYLTAQWISGAFNYVSDKGKVS